MGAWLDGETLLPAGDPRHHRARLLMRERAHRRQRADLEHVVVLGEADRHDGDRLDGRTERRKLADAALQLVAVVDAGAQHQLGVTADTNAAQPLDLLHDLAGARAIHHLAPQLGIGGVDGNVHGAEPLLR